MMMWYDIYAEGFVDDYVGSLLAFSCGDAENEAIKKWPEYEGLYAIAQSEM